MESYFPYVGFTDLQDLQEFTEDSDLFGIPSAPTASGRPGRAMTSCRDGDTGGFLVETAIYRPHGVPWYAVDVRSMDDPEVEVTAVLA